MFRNSRRLWNVRAIPSRVMLCGCIPAMERPAKRTSPDPGWYTPVITLNTVVLPAPLGPITLTISRFPTCRSSSQSACRPPNDSERPSRSRTDPSARAPLTAAPPPPPGAARGPPPAPPARRTPPPPHPGRPRPPPPPPGLPPPPPYPEQPLGPRVHHHDQDRSDHELPGDRRLGDQT